MDLFAIGLAETLKVLFMSTTNKVYVDYQGGDNAIYIGMAAPGMKKSVAGWQIKKMTYDGSNNLIAVKFAYGVLDFNFAWSKRTSHPYS